MVKKRVEYGLLLLAATVFHIFLVDYLSFFVLAFFLALPAVSLLMTVLSVRGLRAELEIKSASLQKSVAIQKREALVISLKVKNNTFLACRVRVKLAIRNELLQEEQTETLFITAGPSGQTVEQVLSSPYCGKLDCRISELRIYDYLGLVSFRKKTAQGESLVVFVLPSVYPLTSLAGGSKIHQDTESDEFSPSKAGDDPGEIFAIREYRNGDLLTRIHWKLSGRHDHLMVKDFGLPMSEEVLLLLDLNGRPKQVDGLLDSLYSLSCFLLEHQILHEIEWYDGLQGGFARTRIVRQDDLNTALSALLSPGRPQRQSLPLANCGSGCGYARYSQVIYLCSGITQDSMALLGERMAGSRVRILLVEEPAELEKMAPSLAAVPGVNLTVIDPEHMRESLSSLTL